MLQEQNSKSKERLRLEEQRAKYEQKLREQIKKDERRQREREKSLKLLIGELFTKHLPDYMLYEEAEMETAWVPLDEALQAILGGEMHSPSAVVGLLALSEARRRNWETLRAPDAPWLRSPGGFQTS